MKVINKLKQLLMVMLVVSSATTNCMLALKKFLFHNEEETIEARNHRVWRDIPLCNDVRFAFSQMNLPSDVTNIALDYTSPFQEVEMSAPIACVKGNQQTDYLRIDLVNGKTISLDLQPLFNKNREVRKREFKTNFTPLLFCGLAHPLIAKSRDPRSTQTKNFSVRILNPVHEEAKRFRDNFSLNLNEQKYGSNKIIVEDQFLKIINNSSSY